ncbi:unnamed protein product [Tenebrio molitor]|nr:unnamed protein product [Tenebrio molitor]
MTSAGRESHPSFQGEVGPLWSFSGLFHVDSCSLGRCVTGPTWGLGC